MKLLAKTASALALTASFGAALAIAPAASAQSGYAQVIGNDLAKCTAGKGPAVSLRIDGLKSSGGNLFVRTYYAKRGDWLKSKRYLTRIDAKPRKGSMTVCVPVPSKGDYAIAVQHDTNGNREMDFSEDGAGMSNNPKIGSFLGIPRPPSVNQVAFRVGNGIKPMSITVRYRN
ncbi:DUF2141 domain-containing protein [Erythrobacter insulae]|uniref:DUF2141 domain-containing protein n=2 Tax=Erythrobacter insulae TaxID=2584124 RepID=A0A547PF19_9SPHN|nr:DUF2141 domain-containing protein [Erythrobacter insulae]